MITLAVACLLSFAAFTPANAVTLTSEEQQLFGLMKNSSGQHRPSLTVNGILTQVARQRAADLANRDYFAHVNPDGHGPNFLVRAAGYKLPTWWGTDPEANYIESIAAGYTSPGSTWDAWMESDPHRTHLLAEESFYSNQTCVGIGHYYSAGTTYKHYWVILSAPPAPKPKVVITSPTQSAQLASDAVQIVGRGLNLPRTSKIQVAIGDGAYVTVPGRGQWSGVVSGLQNGTNVLHVRSRNNGTTIAKASLSVEVIPPVAP
jgi:uncharacterized protein YkwD